MFRIAICDDENTICSQIEQIILHHCTSYKEKIDIDVFTSGEELCNTLIQGDRFDLIFLDIELKSINGVEVGKFIRDEMNDEITQLVYISAKDDYYLELFEVRPMHFLHKPLEPIKIIKDVEKAMELAGRMENIFSYKQGHSTRKIASKKILYFEADNRKVKMYTTEGIISFYETLGKVYHKLEHSHFIYIHKSFLVNYYHIIKFGHKELTMSNNIVLPISQQRRKEVLQLQLNFEGDI